MTSQKRPDESFSEAVERLPGSRSLRDLREVFDDEQVSEIGRPSTPPTIGTGAG